MAASTWARPRRDIASAADDVAGTFDALGIVQFAVMGRSGGGSHCAPPSRDVPRYGAVQHASPAIPVQQEP